MIVNSVHVDAFDQGIGNHLTMQLNGDEVAGIEDFT